MKTSNYVRVNYKYILLTIVLVLAAHTGRAWHANMLDRGDQSVLASPTANFFREMRIIPLPRAGFVAQNSSDYAAEAAAADSADLDSALKKEKIPTERRMAIVAGFTNERAKLTDFRARLSAWNPYEHYGFVNEQYVQLEPEPRPVFAGLDTSALDEVPVEFVDYLQGSVAWFSLQTNEARVNWQELIHRPAGERHYRSTWAAYMLGKSWMREDPETAIGYFEQVRLLKLHGYPDALGLAAASLGDEARVLLNEKRFPEAIQLYIAQYATGQELADSSLRFAIRDAVDEDGFDLTQLATNREMRRVVNAFFASNGGETFVECISSNRVRWLKAVESTDVRDPFSAEQLALIAYEAGEWDTSERWIALTPETPTAQWLTVKLFLHHGKSSHAAEALEQIAGMFPIQDDDDASLHAGHLENTLYISDAGAPGVRGAILAEAGTLRLARGQYAQALDDLLRGGSSADSDYVAERVLTTPELKKYVNQNWPPFADTSTNDPDADLRMGIRSILARRLARAGEFDQARPYYPTNQLADFDLMVSSLDAANSEALSKNERKEAFLAAANIFETNGFELLSTEVWPDWGGYNGDYTDMLDPFGARQATNSILTTASKEEIQRAQDGVDRSLRFHYRYQAAALAWQAARLMEPNSDEQARTLCKAGAWIKARDPKAADTFYKALVVYCGGTAIGAQADRMRWFPTLDDNGNPVPWEPAPPTETNGPAMETAGVWYALHRGNDLRDVAAAAQTDHNIATTVAQLELANPSVNLKRLKAGVKIFVPMQ